MNAEDLKALRAPLILLAVVALIGGIGVYLTRDQLHGAQQQLAQQLAQKEQARKRLAQSDNEKQTIIEYIDDYEKLQNAGFVGEEQRIDWVDGLRLTNQQMRLFGIDYQIGAQQAYPYAGELDAGTLALHASTMKITLPLLHEGDLPDFLATLAAQNVGTFAPTQCTLTRIETGGAIRYQPNLRAECDLAWITVQPTPKPANPS